MWGKALLLTAASVSAAFGAFEVFLRVLPPPGMPNLLPHMTMGQVHIPNLVVSAVDNESGRRVELAYNRWGVRDEDWSEADFNAPFRVMVVGDSFVEAAQVDQSGRFTELLERRLAGKFPGARVFNVGMDSLGPVAYLAYVEHFTKIVRPHLTIVTLFNGNDFQDANAATNPERLTWTEKDGEVVPTADTVSASTRMMWRLRVMLGQSRVLLLANKAVQNVRRRLTEDHREETKGPAACPLFLDPTSSVMRSSMRIVGALLERIHAHAEKRLIVLQIPSKVQVRGRFGEPCRTDLPERWLEALAASRGISIVPMLEAMRAGEEEFFWGHLNDAGHRLVADALFSAISRDFESRH